MTNTVSSVARIVRACRKAQRIADYLASETDDNAWNAIHDIAGDLTDALYEMNGEHTDDLDSSVTDQTIRNPSLTDRDAAVLFLTR